METEPRTNVPSQSRPRATAAMVAALAGVSTATVSLVTNGKTAGRVSTQNIAKVERAIAELGYVVDGIGSSLAKGRSNIVILVAPDVSNPFFAEVIAGVRSAMGKEFQLLLSVTDAGQTPHPDDIRKLFSLRPAGFLVDAPNADFLAALSATGPMVLLDAPGIDSQAPSVNFDVGHGARELANHLASAGHRTVAYLDSVTGTETFRVRREAFYDQAAKLGMAVPEGALASTTVDVGAAAMSFAAAWPAWQQSGVTAVVCCTDTHAYGVVQEARVQGVRIPDQLAVTGFDDLPYSAASNPGLTTVHLPARELGTTAGEWLRRLMAGGVVDQPHVMLESTLVIRGSTVSHPMAHAGTENWLK
ncbi:LacI family DNA-binding transcriptional regulator [Arthrobacter sp. A5]|uniref:LacI family DNA-binding transcriptional regulator n=1 Tax=Arthrobacter sp. A5 TaxID=576926 RepID=UPI003DA7F676